jgi:hypothetical protein
MELDKLIQVQRELNEKDLLIYNSELLKKTKNIGLAYFLLIFFGGLGLHKFYLGKIGEGIAYLIVGVIDLIFLQVIIFNADRYWEPSALVYLLFGVSTFFLLFDLFTLSNKISEDDKKLRIELLAQFGIVLKNEIIEDDNFLSDNYTVDSFIDNQDGTVTNKLTGLMWQRFSIGQTWDGEACIGNPIKMSWDDAMKLTSDFAGYSDWRLPTKYELMILMSANKNQKVGLYWSSSPYVNYSGYEWFVYFFSASSDYYYENNLNLVRLVR